MSVNQTNDRLFSKFKDEKNKTYYSLMKWPNEKIDDNFELTISDTSNTWKTEIKKHILEKKINSDAFNLDKVHEELINALKFNSKSKDNYIISVTLDGTLAKVYWFFLLKMV